MPGFSSKKDFDPILLYKFRVGYVAFCLWIRRSSRTTVECKEVDGVHDMRLLMMVKEVNGCQFLINDEAGRRRLSLESTTLQLKRNGDCERRWSCQDSAQRKIKTSMVRVDLVDDGRSGTVNEGNEMGAVWCLRLW